MRTTALAIACLLAAASLPGCILDPPQPGEDDVPAPIALTRSHPYPDLIVEVDHASGYEPTDEALLVLERELGNVTDKRSITFTKPASIPALSENPDASELRQAHEDALDEDANGTAAILHVVYVNGEYAEDPNVLGIAYSWSRTNPVFLFADRFEETHAPELDPLLPDRLPNLAPETVERAVLVHEVGHALGLVNLTTPMVTDREDPENEHHSANEDSVMYHAVATHLSLAEHLQDNEHIPYQFDAQDREDLRHVREGLTEPIDSRRPAG